MRLTPKETLVRMPSGGSEDGSDPFFIVHPIEGVVKELEYLSSLLPYRVYGFQCTTDVPDDTVHSLAVHYLKIMKTMDIPDPVLLLGYSFGACVAFEMGLLLETEGKTVKLFIVDGSPFFMPERISLYKAKNADTDECDGFAYYITFFKNINLTEFQEIRQEFKALPDMESRLTLCVKKLEGEGESEEDIKLAAATFYKKVLAGERYKPSSNFKGKVILIKADQNFVKLEKDYGLQKVCEQLPEVYTYKSNHKEIIKGQTAKKVANRIINSINP